MGEEIAVAALQDGAQDLPGEDQLEAAGPRGSARVARGRRTQGNANLWNNRFNSCGNSRPSESWRAAIAHDFNNVIGAILGWAEMGCEEAKPGTSLHDRFHKIRDQSLWAARLTSQLLAFARRQVPAASKYRSECTGRRGSRFASQSNWRTN